MADQVDISGGLPGPTSEPVEDGSPRQFGLTAAMALIGNGADRGQHYRCRYLQPSDFAGVLRADHFGEELR
jgi:hypothetical protein